MKRHDYTNKLIFRVLLICIVFINPLFAISSDKDGKDKNNENTINPLIHIGTKPLKTNFSSHSPFKIVGPDPFLFTITSDKEYLGVGEDIEVSIKVSWADFGTNNGVSFLPEWYKYTLKVVFPQGFIQTGGDYTEYCSKMVDAQNPVAIFTIKGQFESNNNNAVFAVLRGFEGSGANSEFIYKTEKKIIVNRSLSYNSQMGIGMSNPKVQPNFISQLKKNKTSKVEKTEGDDCEARIVYEDMEDLDPGENIAPQGWSQDNGLDVQPSGQINMFDAGIKKYLNQVQEPDMFYYPTIPYNTTVNSPNQVLGFASTGGISIYKESITKNYSFVVDKQYYLEFEQAVIANTSKNDRPYFEIQVGTNIIKSTPMADYNGFVKQRFGPFTFSSALQNVKITGVSTSYYSYLLLDNFNMYAYAGNILVKDAPLDKNTIDNACYMIELKPGFDTSTNGTKPSYQEYKTILHGQN